MTENDIVINMAREASDQAPREDWNTNVWVFGEDALHRFAALVAAAEREARLGVEAPMRGFQEGREMIIEAMKQALAALEELQGLCTDADDGWVEAVTISTPEIITTLRAAIEQAQDLIPQDKLFVSGQLGANVTRVREERWQGLTKQEFLDAVDGLEDLEDCWVAIEAMLKEKNG